MWGQSTVLLPWLLLVSPLTKSPIAAVISLHCVPQSVAAAATVLAATAAAREQDYDHAAQAPPQAAEGSTTAGPVLRYLLALRRDVNVWNTPTIPLAAGTGGSIAGCGHAKRAAALALRVHRYVLVSQGHDLPY